MPLQEEEIQQIQTPPLLIFEGLSYDELISLMCKETTHHYFIDVNSDESLISARKEALEWIFKVKAHHGFNALTIVLAVNYFDRFISSFKFQKDKPWMGQLAAVACLSLAGKVEELQVPLLLDLQVEEAEFVFDSKTVQRMELLVSLDCIGNSFTVCEQLLLILIADSKFMLYVPSILAAATMLYVIKDTEPSHYLEYMKQIIRVLKTKEAEVTVCCELISELLDGKSKRNKLENASMDQYQAVLMVFLMHRLTGVTWVICGLQRHHHSCCSKEVDQRIRKCDYLW
ncbi:Detected protein of confused Function [Hibiscus syriacus]|uniref:Detected protein of confused Function n=1 Tax=Hibiscus syriacus TaxID=106335 RepID=A0A6A3BQ66_HIBSY|nr:Detected protein of confused Function [Hibiscus syriacus]